MRNAACGPLINDGSLPLPVAGLCPVSPVINFTNFNAIISLKKTVPGIVQSRKVIEGRP